MLEMSCGLGGKTLKKSMPVLEPRKRAHFPMLAAGLASKMEIDIHPYGAA
jgi:hypothetical protein